MALGQKVKQARLELGLSQRQLCGDTITRNMLSLIENGAASPSLETLRFLAGQLGKPLSYFLEEEALTSPNSSRMEQARFFFGQQKHRAVLEQLSQYRSPDPTFDWEEALLRSLSLLALAEEALALGKGPYALELLEQVREAGEDTPYYTPELERRRLLALSQLTPTQLPCDDRELLHRAETALTQQEPEQAARYLDAAQDRQSPRWNYLRGQCYLALEQYAPARTCFTAGWDHRPKTCATFLEQCCRELEDFKGAYHYACLLREM